MRSSPRVCWRRGAGRAAAGLGALAALAGAARGQDSVSSGPGLPGDAVSAYLGGAAGEQVNNYVVDLAPKVGSWGTRFVLGPVVKASRAADGQHFDLLIGAQAASNAFAYGPLARSAYALWSVPGQGVSAAGNAAPAQSVNGTGRFGPQFAVGFMEFGAGADGAFGTGDDENNAVGTLVNLQRRTPSRLYVSRVVAMVNKTSAAASGTASLGVGGIDAAGNLHLYGDGEGMSHPQRLAQRYAMRVASAARNPSFLNVVIEGLANDGAATRFVRVSPVSMTTPTLVPSATGAGGRPVLLGLDFNGDYLYEASVGATQTTRAYLTDGAGSPRGPLSFAGQVFGPVSVGGSDAGVAACLVRTDGGTRTRGVQVFGVNTDGSVGSTLRLELPATGAAMVDPTDGWNPETHLGAPAGHEFTGYASQASFRGGNGPVATVVLPSGELLAAAVAAPGPGSLVPQGQDNYLAVARVSTGGVVTWSVAAHTGDAQGAAGGMSKVILGDNGADGLPGTMDAGEGDGVVDTGPNAWIGRLAKLVEVSPAQTAGPSVSGAALDRRGNLYFMAGVALRGNDGSFEYTSALLRGVREAAGGGHRLELLARLGDVMPGLNSGRDYQIQFMGFADADSAASGAVWAGNIVQDSIAGTPGGAYGSAMALGALVFRAKIVYDYNGDGVFADPSAGASTSPDQGYNVVMALMPEVRPGDFNLDGAASVQDIFDFLAAYFGGAPGAGDWNGDGVVSVQDIFDFLADYFGA